MPGTIVEIDFSLWQTVLARSLSLFHIGIWYWQAWIMFLKLGEESDLKSSYIESNLSASASAMHIAIQRLWFARKDENRKQFVSKHQWIEPDKYRKTVAKMKRNFHSMALLSSAYCKAYTNSKKWKHGSIYKDAFICLKTTICSIFSFFCFETLKFTCF